MYVFTGIHKMRLTKKSPCLGPCW